MGNINVWRYPGSKRKLLKTLSPYLNKILEGKADFMDVFVGGGSVLLHVAEEHPNLKLYANDKDTEVSAFWNVVANSSDEHFDKLKSKLNVKPTIGMYYDLRSRRAEDEVDAAFRALFFNRTSFSGDMRHAASPIGGKKQLSEWTVDCRYKADKMMKNLDRIRILLKDRVEVSNIDVLEALSNRQCPTYLDPPYYVAGKGLYEHAMRDEEHHLLALALKHRADWILSYDAAEQIASLYRWAEVKPVDVKYCIKGKKLSWNETKELLILPNDELVEETTSA